MSNNNSNSKKTVFCVYGIIVLSFLEAHTIAFGQILLDDTIYNLKGERAYEKRFQQFLSHPNSIPDMF